MQTHAQNRYCLGIDFGTDSVRCLLVDAANGQTMAEGACAYPRWKEGLYCDAAQKIFRQHPLDYIESLEQVVKIVLSKVEGNIAGQIGALSIDTTGSTPAPVDINGTPLALLEEFKEDPEAMFYLWKDHSGIDEASDINHYNAGLSPATGGYLDFVGGYYSPEWFWSKWLHLLRQHSRAAKACYCFVEHADWMPFLLTGGRDVRQLKRNVCSAGHKGLWSEKWQGYPTEEFLAGVDPLLSGMRERLSPAHFTSDVSAGNISQPWAEKLGLPEGVKIGIGALDAHMGAVGGQIEPYYLSKVMGTSTCDMMVVPLKEMKDQTVGGICGQVPGSIIPQMMGLEAGQSAFGDVYGWFSSFLLKSMGLLGHQTGEQDKEKLLQRLSQQAETLSLEQWKRLPVSTDWFNGRRSPDVNPDLKAAITGLDLSRGPIDVFASLVEATCFGSQMIVERFVSNGVPVKGIIGLGGIAHKSPFVMQLMADILDRPIKINQSDECCALGAAMFAATQAGWYRRVEDAMQSMGQGFLTTYLPTSDQRWKSLIKERYRRYQQIGDFSLSYFLREDC
ncbi:L-ribulokinase [Arachidicoccus rhizosphaerae]|uniref:L-ribulokinase n=1 Tax=Arachidicoccus rhizosphaerae TaxID=551991 RepID=A0A1H4AU74_9BACT|nr:ribulokinase [Arachidicoccus rhizosphaerae]SEA39348.1 L-ribulokinase [Arachidicoccus rhizosphaerae]